MATFGRAARTVRLNVLVIGLGLEFVELLLVELDDEAERVGIVIVDDEALERVALPIEGYGAAIFVDCGLIARAQFAAARLTVEVQIDDEAGISCDSDSVLEGDGEARGAADLGAGAASAVVIVAAGEEENEERGDEDGVGESFKHFWIQEWGGSRKGRWFGRWFGEIVARDCEFEQGAGCFFLSLIFRRFYLFPPLFWRERATFFS